MSLTDAVRAKSFQRFIDENPSTISLERGEFTRTPAGGQTWAKTADIDPQVGRIIYLSNEGDRIVRTNPDGSPLVVTHRLVFMPGADVERFDRFQYEGFQYVIAWVERVPTWRVACQVGRRDG